jgi:hypothetical protein
MQSKNIEEELKTKLPAHVEGSEEFNNAAEQEKQLNELIQQLQGLNMSDFMTPTQKEIADLTVTELDVEYKLVQSKLSTRKRMQRDLIVSRWLYEQKNPDKLQETTLGKVMPSIDVKKKKIKKNSKETSEKN